MSQVKYWREIQNEQGTVLLTIYQHSRAKSIILLSQSIITSYRKSRRTEEMLKVEEWMDLDHFATFSENNKVHI